MKTNIFKIFNVLATLFLLNSCNHNSPAPVQPASVTPTSTTPTNTTTPEGLAIDIQGHWYLDSSILYSSPTNFTVTRYGFSATPTSGSSATHYEVNITNVITYTQTPSTLATQSNIRTTSNINWLRGLTNDTVSYTSTAGSCIVSIVNNNLFVSATGYMNNYLRNYTGTTLELK